MDRAREISESAAIVTLSAGTVHKPPPTDHSGYPVVESIAAARYLIRHGVAAARVFAETCSLDTIGNAYFSRVIHVDPAKWRKLLVVTSEFHMARTRAIFEWIYSLNQVHDGFHLSFDAVPDAGIAPEDLAERTSKENRGLSSVKKLSKELRDLKGVHEWLFTAHDAYSMKKRAAVKLTEGVLRTY